MSIKINFNSDDFIKYMKNVKIACDNFKEAMARDLIKNNDKMISKIAKEYRKDLLYKKLIIMFKE